MQPIAASMPTNGWTKMPSNKENMKSAIERYIKHSLGFRAIFAHVLSIGLVHLRRVRIYVSVALFTRHNTHIIWPKTDTRFASGYPSPAAKLLILKVYTRSAVAQGSGVYN
jgi:hypothetical protein